MIKQRLGAMASTLLMWVVALLCLPLMILILVGQVLYTPIEYLKFKRSRYQQDFPRKYSLWCGVHPDNEVYTLIKENDLPIEYIKWNEDYDLHGYFVSGDVLLNFTEPFFFDEQSETWLLWPGNSEKENDEVEDVDVEHVGEDNADDCLTAEEAKAFLLDCFRADVGDRACYRVVVFYERKKAEKNYGKEAVEKLKATKDFVVYERGELLQAIRSVIHE